MNYKQIIDIEKSIWMTAYPAQRKLIEKFADKIKMEIRWHGESDLPKEVKGK